MGVKSAHQLLYLVKNVSIAALKRVARSRREDESSPCKIDVDCSIILKRVRDFTFLKPNAKEVKKKTMLGMHDIDMLERSREELAAMMMMAGGHSGGNVAIRWQTILAH